MIDFRFYLVTDRTQCAPKSLASVVHDAVVSGVRAVQLREKDLSETDLVNSATRLMDVMRPRGARLLVNVSEFVEDDTAMLLAATPGVDGFHVPDNVELVTRFAATLRVEPAHRGQSGGGVEARVPRARSPPLRYGAERRLAAHGVRAEHP
jgi:thiamine monophosphate synthase